VVVQVVSPSRPEALQAFLKSQPLEEPLWGDPDRLLYQAWGLERTQWSEFLRPRVLWHYLKLLCRGSRLRWPFAGEDVYQLGGDAIVQPDGTLVWLYSSRGSTDRPNHEELRRQLDRWSPNKL
jgi:hypothetical protein